MWQFIGCLYEEDVVALLNGLHERSMSIKQPIDFEIKTPSVRSKYAYVVFWWEDPEWTKK